MHTIAGNIDCGSAERTEQCAEENKLDVHELRSLGQIARKRGDHPAALAHFQAAAPARVLQITPVTIRECWRHGRKALPVAAGAIGRRWAAARCVFRALKAPPRLV